MIDPVSLRTTTSRRVVLLAALAGASSLATIRPATAAQATPPVVSGKGLAATQFRWLLERVNSGATDLTADDIQTHFTKRFVDAVGIDAIIAQIHDIAAHGAPFTIVTVIQETEDLVHVQATASDGSLVVIAVSIEHSDEKIAGFIFQPGAADQPFATPASSPLPRQ